MSAPGPENKIAMCWRILHPLVEKSRKILSQGDEYKERTDKLNELMGRAGALRRTDPEVGASLVEESIRLLAREAPPRPDDVMNLLRQLGGILPASILSQIKRQIDFQFPGTICQAILRAEEELRRYAGPPATDSTALTADAPFAAAEINLLEVRIQEAEEQQRKNDDRERERSEAEQRQARESQKKNAITGSVWQSVLSAGGLVQETPPSKVIPSPKSGRAEKKKPGPTPGKNTKILLELWDKGLRGKKLKLEFFSRLPKPQKKTKARRDDVWNKAYDTFRKARKLRAKIKRS
jgi:hypothetical protein